MAKTIKKTKTKSVAKKSVLPKVKKVTAKMFVNEYDIPMIELATKPRSIFISVKKVLAILATDVKSCVKVTKYGRELCQVDYGTGKSFLIGEVKLTSVIANKKAIEKAVA